MTKTEISKTYDLEDRTKKFAQQVRNFIKELPRSITMIEDSKQLARSSGSIDANYIEANESLSKKDFLMRIKICRKEAKETSYWLELISIENPQTTNEKDMLAQEAKELMMIFGSIIRKSENV